MSSESPSPRVGLLYDSVSENTGDIAIGLAGIQELERQGIDDVVVLSPFDVRPESVDLTIVGGGELIRPRGDAFYDAFRPVAGDVLNAAGVWQTADDLGYLAQYEVVSARNSTEAAVLAGSVDDVGVLPCTTTTLESPRFEIPGAEPGDRLIGIHVVPHTLVVCPDIVEQINALEGRKVFIPFTHYNHDASFMSALPFDRTDAIILPRLKPLELHSVLGQMDFVVVSSLHASLFAYSQNVPFATVHQEKVLNYFKDRGLERFVFDGPESLRAAMTEIELGGLDFSEQVAEEKRVVNEAYARFAALARTRAATRQGELPAVEVDPSLAQRDALLIEQLSHVVVGRDRVIAHDQVRLMEAEHHAQRWHDEADRLAAEIELLSARVLEPPASTPTPPAGFKERVQRVGERAAAHFHRS
ncbi:polysaccharide pyruvyl transferase family protein [Sanguibacter sp. 25GB23B1]|uniref:polysaccharide pyruvyl transferase family protein n=1 Tax=unclassified Sanguibacter TaxID=2645534 RepID=UPI0032B01DF8